VKQERLGTLGPLILAAMCLSFAAGSAPAQAKSSSGKLAGVVHDTVGTPQMGATVEVLPEAGGKTIPLGLLTNTLGVFQGERLAPGFYTVRVTLAGFLPTIQQHVRISAHLTTVVRIEMESMFASLDQLRRQPASVSVESDDWKWVLRSASATRPVLQWMDDGTDTTNLAFDVRAMQPRAKLEFTDGARVLALRRISPLRRPLRLPTIRNWAVPAGCCLPGRPIMRAKLPAVGSPQCGCPQAP
jgi:hypothetical protein